MLKKFFKKNEEKSSSTIKPPPTNKDGNKKVGAYGEKLAQEYLEKNGYKIVEVNKRFSRSCEIDIIALDEKNKKELVFVEVKTRSSGYCGSGFEAITKTKYKNIQTGLYTYLQENPQHKTFRIDVISVILKPELKIEHLKRI